MEKADFLMTRLMIKMVFLEILIRSYDVIASVKSLGYFQAYYFMLDGCRSFNASLHAYLAHLPLRTFANILYVEPDHTLKFRCRGVLN